MKIIDTHNHFNIGSKFDCIENEAHKRNMDFIKEEYKNHGIFACGFLLSRLSQRKKIAEEENMIIAGLAISYIRDLQGVSSLVMGAEKPVQVKENIELINVKKISDTAREKIISAFYNIDERVLQPWLWNK